MSESATTVTKSWIEREAAPGHMGRTQEIHLARTNGRKTMKIVTKFLLASVLALAAFAPALADDAMDHRMHVTGKRAPHAMSDNIAAMREWVMVPTRWRPNQRSPSKATAIGTSTISESAARAKRPQLGSSRRRGRRHGGLFCVRTGGKMRVLDPVGAEKFYERK